MTMEPSNLSAAANGKILILAVPYSDRGEKVHTACGGVREMRNRVSYACICSPAFAALPLFASTDGVIDLMYNISL